MFFPVSCFPHLFLSICPSLSGQIIWPKKHRSCMDNQQHCLFLALHTSSTQLAEESWKIKTLKLYTALLKSSQGPASEDRLVS